MVGRLTGTRSRANTMALAALVGTQLGQTITLGPADREVLLTSIGSALVMAAIVQTPGLSHLFGCQPLGPLAWATVATSSAAATGLSLVAQRSVERVETWLEGWIGPATRTETPVVVHVDRPGTPRDPALTGSGNG